MPAQALPRTDRILSTLMDMRIPLTFSLEDCTLIAEIIANVFSKHLGETSDVESGPGDWPQ